jgi:hypothetical protein
MRSLLSLDDKTSEMVFQIIAERIAAARKRVPKKEYVSALSRPEHPGIIRARHYALPLVAILGSFSLFDLYKPLGEYSSVSLITAIAAAALLILPLIELLTSAGVHIEREYKIGPEFGREYSFQPSLSSFGDLIPPVALAIFALITSFASLHAALSRSDPSSYTTSLSGLDALYHSTLVFSAGSADESPLLPLPRILTAVQSFLSWAVTSLLLATLLAWVLENHQSIQQRRQQTAQEEMLSREETFRLAKIGVYGHISELIEEAEKRLAENSPPPQQGSA